MKRLILYFMVFSVSMSLGLAEGGRPKIGLVLSGGGARGFAHVGTLHMIDSLKIPIDYIVGTSMGGVVGALYAIGYDAIEIENLINSVDWKQMLSDDPPRDMVSYVEKYDDNLYQFDFGFSGYLPAAPSGLISGQHISLMLSRMTFAFEHVDNFDALPIPFRCVAVDLISGREVILDKGSLSKAIRSTMSIPSLFSPVEWGDSLLIDGGLLNNLPTDIAQEMGSELLIAVNVGRPKRTKDQLGDLIDILEQSISIPGYLKEEKNIKLANILISPDLSKLSQADFSKQNVKGIVKEGYRAARASLPQLKALMDSLGLATRVSEFELKVEPSLVSSLRIAGNTTLPFEYVYNSLDLNPGDSLNYMQLIDKIRALRANPRFNRVSYSINLNESADLDVFVRVKELSRPVIFSFKIYGNESLSFPYLYNFMGIKPGDEFDITAIEAKITELYSLGYYETVNYDIIPVNKDQIIFNLHLKEKSNQRLSLGVHYNDFHYILAHLRWINANTLIRGLRLQAHLDFVGLTHFQIKAFYPKGSKGFLFYPFIQAEYHDERVPVNDLNGPIALYNDSFYKFKLGVGFWPSKSTQLELGLERVAYDITPEIGTRGLPEWQNNLNLVTASLDIDGLDRSLIPTSGWRLNSGFEWSSTKLNSVFNYTRFQIMYETYMQTSANTNYRFKAHFGAAAGVDSLNYLWFYTGGPDSFVGIDYFRLGWVRVANFRLDRRYQLNEQTYLTSSYNIAPNFNWLKGEQFYPSTVTFIQGLGVGVLYDSPLGPIELTYSRGDSDLNENMHFKSSFVYFTVGGHF
ncbi:MAG: patatin-like phospholipase family protein [Candidatus Marinimicrobia bacterium]|nr:patatin-like phospholipase family protein [Candidatus Neomarinimicrobiota bacterium]